MRQVQGVMVGSWLRVHDRMLERLLVPMSMSMWVCTRIRLGKAAAAAHLGQRLQYLRRPITLQGWLPLRLSQRVVCPEAPTPRPLPRSPAAACVTSSVGGRVGARHHAATMIDMPCLDVTQGSIQHIHRSCVLHPKAAGIHLIHQAIHHSKLYIKI